MKHSDFVPLHLHTEYSLLDGAIRIDELIDKAKEYRMPALAITDHGNLFGAINFYQKVRNAEMKPIIGCEVYVAPKTRFEKNKNEAKGSYFHLILLAKNSEGYKNLTTLVTKAYLEGFYYKPRIDKDLLEQYCGGLIGLSACLKGEVPFYLQRDMIERARETALQYKRIFGPDDFYLELQENELPEQYEVNKKLVELSKDLHIKLVATNDCHYMRREDAKAHDILVCIKTGKTITDTDRLKFKTEGLYFRSPEEMKKSFSEMPEVILNTREIAEKCNVVFDLHKIKLPSYSIESGEPSEKFLENLARKGLKSKIGDSPSREYMERFDNELKTIVKTGFSSYFLIVWDFINYAKSKNIIVGPGRGSAAGSLIAYCLGITDIDPLKYNLLFERFLNAERISLPDIDVDFCKDRRGEVIAYTQKKYGIDHVAQIITFGTMAAKASIRDVGRALGMPYSEVDRIAKLVPYAPNISIKEALEAEPELQKSYKGSKGIKELLDIALRLEGLCRHASTHAAGVVISPTPLTDDTPLYKSSSEDVITTQYDMKSIETIGLLKFDFLGLKTLTVLQKTLEYLEKRGTKLRLEDIPFDDKNTYKLLGSGMTIGIFQLESPGMRDILIKMKPNRFEDLIALVALYRPGPIGSGMIDDFIKRKKGEIAVKYELPQLKEILDETYGVILYQEQVMRIANRLANFTMGQADILRKAMGKKIPYEMERLKEEFIDGATKNGINEKKANRIFDLMSLFAKYGFNKSHSAAYAYIAYQTAYLKTHHPVEFMAANLSSEDNTDKIVKFIKECQDMSIEILPPDINVSERLFKIIDNAVSFGLEAVKGVGASAIESIINIRNQTPFKSLDDFITRVDSRKVNKKVIESLIKSGAFSSITESRAMAMDRLEILLSGKRSMPSLFGQQTFLGESQQKEDIYEWEERDLLRFEKQALGFYITSHPLKKYSMELNEIDTVKTSSISDSEIHNKNQKQKNDSIKVAGIISSIKRKQLKENKGTMAILILEDDEGSIEVIVFPDVYKKAQDILIKDIPIVIKGTLDLTDKGNKIKASEVLEINEAVKHYKNKSRRDNNKKEKNVNSQSIIFINLPVTLCNHEIFSKLKEILSSCEANFHDSLPSFHKEDLSVHIRLSYEGFQTTIATPYKTHDDAHLIKEIESITGKDSVSFN